MSNPAIPGYRIVRELGRGGMATVYLAIQESSDREVAVKVMDREMLHDETFGKRFQRESQIVAKLDHPHIIKVHDVGLVDENHYLCMELVTGGELNDRLEHGLEAKEAIRIIKQIARALDFAHSKGFIHRDIKPENILFREEGSAVLSDFGIARDIDNETQITTIGSVVGTPYYMSPEQVTGERLDGRSDLYSLGVVFYKTLTGKVPYDGDSALNIGIRHIKDPVPRLPPGLSAMQPLIDRFMAKTPDHRFQSGQEIVDALEKFERSNAMPQSVARTEILGPDVVSEIKRATGQSPSAPNGWPTNRPSATRVLQVRGKRNSPLRFLIIGVALALVFVGGAAWLILESRSGSDDGDAPSAGVPEQEAVPAAPVRESMAQLLGRADALRARGVLLEPPGGNALEAYREALERDSGNRTALAGLDAIGRSVAEQGETDLRAGRVEAAREQLTLASELAADAQAVLTLEALLGSHDAAVELVESARAQFEAGNLTRPADSSAVALLRQALESEIRPAVAESFRSELIRDLEGIAAEARKFGMNEAARPYAKAASDLAAL